MVPRSDRLPRSGWRDRVHPLALLAALVLHGTALLLLLSFGRPAPPPPEPPVTIALEVLLALTEAAAASPSEATTAPAPDSALSPSPPSAAVAPPPEPVAPLAPSAVLPDARVPTPPDSVVPPLVPDNPPAEVATQPPSPETTPAPPRLMPHHPVRRNANSSRPILERTTPNETATSPDAVPSSTAPSAAPPAAAPASISPSWQGQLAAWLQAHKTYPEAARERGTQGTAAVRFTVARDGRVLAISLVAGSGSGLLDTAATAMLRDAHVPPFPAAMPQAEITVVVNIRYTLER